MTTCRTFGQVVPRDRGGATRFPTVGERLREAEQTLIEAGDMLREADERAARAEAAARTAKADLALAEAHRREAVDALVEQGQILTVALSLLEDVAGFTEGDVERIMEQGDLAGCDDLPRRGSH